MYCVYKLYLTCENISFVSVDRQILSWYTLSQNPCVSGVANNAALHPLWVRCDMSDPAKTMWMGAETVCTGTNVSGVILYSITSKGMTQILYSVFLISFTKYLFIKYCNFFIDSAVNKEALITLDEVKREHKKRHHTSLVSAHPHCPVNVIGNVMLHI